MNVIFVCTGNTCRSPMAEHYLKSKNLKDVCVISRGFSSGESANPNSIAVMADINIDITAHVSKCISTDEINRADKIICMTESHKQLLLLQGAPQNKLFVLSGGISDPFGLDIATYACCRDAITNGIDGLISDGFFDEIKISIATEKDVSNIALIEKASFSTPWSENAILESMNATTTFYVARKQGKTAGYMGLSKIAGEGYVTNVAVLPDYRRLGIGKKILEYAIADSNGLEFISLEVRASNTPAITLYNSLGFTQVGVRKRFYTNPTEDAIIMTKTFLE